MCQTETGQVGSERPWRGCLGVADGVEKSLLVLLKLGRTARSGCATSGGFTGVYYEVVSWNDETPQHVCFD